MIIEETEMKYEVFLEADRPKWVFLFDVYFTKLRDNLERELKTLVNPQRKMHRPILILLSGTLVISFQRLGQCSAQAHIIISNAAEFF